MSETSENRLEIVRALSASPIARWLGYSAAIEDGGLAHRLSFAERHIGNPAIRALHGGVIASFLEFAAEVEFSVSVGRPEKARTVSLAIDYMTSSKAQDMTARVVIARAARRIAFLEATGWQEDETRPVATARICLRIGELARE